MSTLKKRVEDLEQCVLPDDGGGWEILMVELTDDGPDEETAIALARAAALAEGRRVMPTTGDQHVKPVTGGLPGRVRISMVIVDMRTDKTNGGDK